MRIALFGSAIALTAFNCLAAPVGESNSKKKDRYAESIPEPTLSDVAYGNKKRNVMDFWKAPSDKPTPVVIAIHGGGWNGGSKEMLDKFVDTEALLEAGISVAAINYRLIKHSKDLEPPVKGPMSDAARAVQFLRSKAEEWNLDKDSIAATGGSAGACSALWVAYHDDLAVPDSSDPIGRESSRLACVAVLRVQSTLDPKQIKEWLPNCTYGAHAFGKESFDQFLADREQILPSIKEYSPYANLSSDDPPTYMFYPEAPKKVTSEKQSIHSPIFGIKLQEHCKKVGVSCELVYPGARRVKHQTPTAYFIEYFSN